jgi:V/A-type H+-transporting ATPase subunit F
MQFFLISDNIDTQMGMRLAGIRGVVVHEEQEVKNALSDAMEDKDIAVVLMTEKLVKLCEDFVYDLKLNRKQPLIVEIPDRHATTDIGSTISRYVENAIGIRI